MKRSNVRGKCESFDEPYKGASLEHALSRLINLIHRTLYKRPGAWIRMLAIAD
jgi:hypothetical protein